MKVSELRRRLEAMPDDTEVVIRWYGDDLDGEFDTVICRQGYSDGPITKIALSWPHRMAS